MFPELVEGARPNRSLSLSKGSLSLSKGPVWSLSLSSGRFHGARRPFDKLRERPPYVERASELSAAGLTEMVVFKSDVGHVRRYESQLPFVTIRDQTPVRDLLTAAECDSLHRAERGYGGRVSQFKGHLLLALSVLVGSAIPFVPTGEMVSGAAAFASHSRLNVLVIFLVTWVCSVLGDTVMLVEARLGARRLRPWLARRKFAERVNQAQEGLTRNAFNAIVTGRLIPGGRTPVIVALGLSRFSFRRFMLMDLVACGLWAGIYSTIGSIGGRIANHPVWAMVIAIAFAVSMGALVQQIRRFFQWRRTRQPAPDSDLDRDPERR